MLNRIAIVRANYVLLLIFKISKIVTIKLKLVRELFHFFDALKKRKVKKFVTLLINDEIINFKIF